MQWTVNLLMWGSTPTYGVLFR